MASPWRIALLFLVVLPFTADACSFLLTSVRVPPSTFSLINFHLRFRGPDLTTRWRHPLAAGARSPAGSARRQPPLRAVLATPGRAAPRSPPLAQSKGKSICEDSVRHGLQTRPSRGSKSP